MRIGMEMHPRFSGVKTILNRFTVLVFATICFSLPAYAAQTGDVTGVVTKASDGSALAGVTVEATSSVLPQKRSTTSGPNGKYRFPLLPPGAYELKFTSPDGSTAIRGAGVLLQQQTKVNVSMGAGGDYEEILVTAAQPLTNTNGAALSNAIGSDYIDELPVGQEYRDLIKLIPGVQYSEDSVRGPSAGGSGQDNAYAFDGVDVSLPMFGTLSAEPSSHDIAQVAVVRGGAKAVGFNRSGGFSINTISKSGTDEFHGELSYQIQTDSTTGSLDTGSNEQFEEDKAWTTVSIGGPIIPERLFFYGSYYKPTITRDSVSNVYGPIGDFDSDRDEFFGKLTFAPTDSILLDASFRTSEREVQNRGVGEFEAGSASEGDEATLDIAIVEGSWVINDRNSMSFKYTSFENDTASRPDTEFSFPIMTGGMLDVSALDTQGRFSVPTPIAGETAFNAFIQPLIDTYGYSDGGVQTGGGAVGGASTISNQDFTRESFEVNYDHTLYMGEFTHDFHFGYKYNKDEEDLSRLSNGWGSITVPGGRSLANDGITPVFFEARFQQQSLNDPTDAVSPNIHSEFEAHSFEINDTIEWGDFTFNVGVLVSQDELFGQGLREVENGTNISGFELAPGNKYRMHKVDFSQMIQPRLGANWDYSDRGSAFVNYARYHPSASSLARAASWDRNLRRSIRARFDANGNFIDTDPVRSSSGKVFQDGIEPRKIDEFLVGGSWVFSGSLNGRAHIRYREGDNFWEDTNNNARSRFNAPAGISQADYILNLADIRAEIGGSSYVIAELDDAFTKYWEASFELEWDGDNSFIRGSYVWSHYYGNFDQDNTTTSNDANSFIGSSFISDGAGRQLWNMRRGDLRGDRRHQLKVYGAYSFSWNGSAGAYFVWQSGQPWEAWDVEVYRALTGSSSDTSRFAESAGSRTTSSHWQLDLNYTQEFVFRDQYTLVLRADLFNAFDRQTGYNIQNKVNSAGFGDARDFFNPRRLQLAIKLRF